jgi:chromosome segregation ATPase
MKIRLEELQKQMPVIAELEAEVEKLEAENRSLTLAHDDQVDAVFEAVRRGDTYKEQAEEANADANTYLDKVKQLEAEVEKLKAENKKLKASDPEAHLAGLVNKLEADYTLMETEWTNEVEKRTKLEAENKQLKESIEYCSGNCKVNEEG